MGHFLHVTSRGTRSASTAFEARGELLAAHASPGEVCAASEAARSAEALEQESVPREVTSMCPPAQSNMTCEDRGRTDVTSARIIVAWCVSAGPGPAEHPPSRRTTLSSSPGPVSRYASAARPRSTFGRSSIQSSIGGQRTTYEPYTVRLARCDSSHKAAEGVRKVNPCKAVSPLRCSMLLKG